MYSFPSQIVQVTIHGKSEDYQINIPKDEIFRIENIFTHDEYAIPADYLANKKLIVVDIGANVGLFALYMKLLRAESVIHCFEPAPATLQLLHANINHMNDVHIHPFGISNCSKKVTMALHPYNTGENSIKFVSPESDQEVEISIRNAADTMNRLQLQTIDVLKIDTEGCEVEILESLQPMINRVGIILVEYHTEKDRRRIDQLLPKFHLFGGIVTTFDLGTLKYIHERFVS